MRVRFIIGNGLNASGVASVATGGVHVNVILLPLCYFYSRLCVTNMCYKCRVLLLVISAGVNY